MAHAHRTARGWLILLTVLLLAFVATVVWVVVSRTQGGSGASTTTVSQEQDDAAANGDEGAASGDGDGWFTEVQAARGEAAYAESCASCHGPDLEGGSGPALTGDTFWDRWGGETVHTLFEVTRQTMPQEAPGSLEPDTYADITAHLLNVNGFPTGDDELPPDEDHLTGLVIEEASADEGAEEAPADADAPESEGSGADAEDANGAAEGDVDREDAADAEAGATPEADEPAPADEAATDGEGWFSEAQVRAGEATYAEHCARCHGDDLQGDPPLVGGFAERYGTVYALYQYVRQTMPLDHPGSLPNQAYLDAVAYLLDENGYPMGEHRREPVRAVLEDMDLTTERSEPAADEDGAAADEGDDGADGADGADTGDDAADGADAGDDAADGADDGADGRDDQADDAETEGANDADADADDPAAASADGTGEGLYDQEQADRGQEPYAQHCAQCHGDDLQGQPPLVGDGFLGTYETVWDLYEYTRDNMPQGDPGSLDDATYADIVAYVLSENDLPDGGEELDPDQEDAMRDLPLDPDAADGEAPGEGEAAGDADAEDRNGEDATTGADATTDAAEAGAEGDDADAEAARGDEAEARDDERELPALASLEIDARPANMTVNLLGPDGLVRRAVGAQTLADLQPGRYVVAGSRGHQSTVVNVQVGAGESVTVRLVLDELERSADVPEEPSMPTTEVPAISREPGEGVLIGAAPGAAPDATAARDGGAPDTEFAAGRGQQAYALHCARCHGADLEGNVAPALAGDVFFERWGGHPVDWFYFQARASMPPHGAGSLSETTYADIVAYVLTTNGVIEGFESYAPGDEAFRSLVIEPRHATAGHPDLEARIERLREVLHGAQVEGDATEVGPVMPVEWPDDPGVAPIGNRARIDASAVSEPRTSDTEPEVATEATAGDEGDVDEPGQEDVPEDDEGDDAAGDDEGRVDDAARRIHAWGPAATTGGAA